MQDETKDNKRNPDPTQDQPEARSNPARRRIQKEYTNLQKDSPPGIVWAGPIAEADMFNWQATRGLPLRRWTVFLRISFPAEYPFRPPTLQFATKSTTTKHQRGWTSLAQYSAARVVTCTDDRQSDPLYLQA
jgi:hypothetical protein